MSDQRKSSSRLSLVFLREIIRFFCVGGYEYSPTIFTRKHPSSFITIRLLSAYAGYLSCVLVILRYCVEMLGYGQLVLGIQSVLVILVYASVFLAIYSRTLQGFSYRKKHLNFWRSARENQKLFVVTACVQGCTVLLIACGISAIVIEKYTRIFIEHKWSIDPHSMWMIILMLVGMIIVANMITSYRITKANIAQDYATRIAHYNATIDNYGTVKIPGGMLLVDDAEIEKNAYRPQLLQPYLGNLTLESAQLSTTKIQFLINKITAYIMQLKIFLQIFTVLGGFLASRLIAFEYSSLYHHEHFFTGKHILAMLLIFSYIFTLVFISMKLETKNQALKLVQDYQKKLPEEDQPPMQVSLSIPKKITRKLPGVTALSRRWQRQ